MKFKLLARIFHNQAARCLPILIHTPLQWGGQQLQDTANRFSGFDPVRKTAEAVRSRLATQITPLKWGVNESARSERTRTCEISGLAAVLAAGMGVAICATADTVVYQPKAANKNDHDASLRSDTRNCTSCSGSDSLHIMNHVGSYIGNYAVQFDGSSAWPIFRTSERRNWFSQGLPHLRA